MHKGDYYKKDTHSRFMRRIAVIYLCLHTQASRWVTALSYPCSVSNCLKPGRSIRVKYYFHTICSGETKDKEKLSPHMSDARQWNGI